MMDKEKTIFDEPQVFGLAKYRLIYSVIIILVITGGMLFNDKRPPIICFVPILLLAAYLFLPFTYKLIVSDEAISSIDLFSTKTLEWNDIAEIGLHNGSPLLSNRDGVIKIKINQQIDGYPEVLKFVKLKRPDLWKLDNIQIFHQTNLESLISIFLGMAMLVATGWALIENGMSKETGLLVLLFLIFSAFLIVPGLIKARKLSLEGETLVVSYLVWERRIHVHDVWSVGLEQEFGKNFISHAVHIRLKSGADIIVHKVKEGNPFLVNAVELWLKKYKPQQGIEDETD